MTFSSEPNPLPRNQSLGWLVAVLARQLADDLDGRLKQIGLNLGLWPTLFALWEQEGLTQTELAERCMTAHYTTTRTLDTLEGMGLVERRPHPTSRRALQIFLTPAGHDLRDRAMGHAQACNQSWLGKLGPEDSQELMRLLTRLVGVASQETGAL